MRSPARVSPILLCSLLALLLTGCLRLTPKKPVLLNSPLVLNYSPDQLKSDVNEYNRVLVTNPAQAKQIRNAICFRVMAQIDAAYGGFEAQVFAGRASLMTAGDAAQAGVSAAATVVGAAGLKDILVAASSSLAGARLSVDKNFFEQKSTEAVLSQMRASRSVAKTQLLKSLDTRDVSSYPLEFAYTDLTSYYYAGTLSSALIEIASKAGSDAVAAKKDLADEVAELTPASATEQKNAITNRREYTKLAADLASADPAVVAAARETLLKIASALDPTTNPTMSNDDLLKNFLSAIKATENDKAKATQLTAIVLGATS